MIPMGTVVTSCMLAGLIVALPIVLGKAIPSIIRFPVAAVLAAAGLWNVSWYATRHIGEFWGSAALVSGLLMLITAATLVNALPSWLFKLRFVFIGGLAVCFVLYATTIYRL